MHFWTVKGNKTHRKCRFNGQTQFEAFTFDSFDKLDSEEGEQKKKS